MGGVQVLLFSFLALYGAAATVNGQSTNITSLPVTLFGANGGVHSVVEGSVIQLYCSVEPVTAILSWTQDGVSVIIDVPHLRVRTSSNGTHNTSVLTLDNFRSGDNGMYQCHAMSGGVTESGDTVSLRAVSSSASGTLELGQQPTDNSVTRIAGSENPLRILRDNRTAVSLGDTIDPTSTPDADKLLRCVAGHQNDHRTNFSPSTVVWIKDGETVEDGGDITISTSMEANGEVSSTLQITNFQESNAGVYQCIFTDGSDGSGNEGEIITTIPLRLDTGETLITTGISPQTIVLRPPDKLVIEVEVTGRYAFINWERNGQIFSPFSDQPFYIRIPNSYPLSSELVNYFEIFVREPTTESDLGVYSIRVNPFNLTHQDFTQGEAVFNVILPVNANTTAVSESTVTVLEGDYVDISCTSTGVPTPSITWSFNDTTAPFNQTDIVVDFSTTFQFTRFNPTLELGNFTSVLHIVNASYPDHDGEYTCVGANIRQNAFLSSSSETITVRVHVPPTIIALDDDQEIIANESESAVLSFRIERAVPPVSTEDIRWIYSFQFPVSPFPGGPDDDAQVMYENITSLTTRTNTSKILFSRDLLSLTLDGIVQAQRVGSDDFVTDQGRYFLVVAHPTGVWFSYTDVIVRGPPVIFSKPLNQTVIDDGGNVTNVVFRCSAVAFPQHSVSWIFTDFEGVQTNIISTGSIAGDTSKYQIVRDSDSDRFGELTVLDVQYMDRGTYNCTAENNIGFETRGAILTVLRLPPTPTLLSVTSVTSHSVVVSWQIDTSTIPITGYMVRVVTSTTGQVVFSGENLSSDILMLTLRDLQPTTDYQFFISAVNTAGTGEQASVTFTTITDVIPFQLRLLLAQSGVGRSCNEWVAIDQAGIEQAADEVANAIVTNVEERCQCGFTRSNITSDGFRCFPGSTDAVTYRGEIHETDTVSVFDLIRHIEEWTAGEVLIRVQRVFIKVDSSCRVAIESFTEEECLPREPPREDGGNGSAAVIAGAVVAVVIVLVLIGLIVVVIVILYLSRKRTCKLQDTKITIGVHNRVIADSIKKTKEDEAGEEPEYEVVNLVPLPRDYEIPLNSYNQDYEPVDVNSSTNQVPVSTAANQYHEVTNKIDNETKMKSRRDDSFDLSECPAYKTTKHSSQATGNSGVEEEEVIENPGAMEADEEDEYIEPMTWSSGLPEGKERGSVQDSEDTRTDLETNNTEEQVKKNPGAMETDEDYEVMASISSKAKMSPQVTRNGNLDEKNQ